MGQAAERVGALGLVVESVPELLGRLDQFADKIEEAPLRNRRGRPAGAGDRRAAVLPRRTSAAARDRPDGEGRFLEGGAGPPLCIVAGDEKRRPEGRAVLAEGSTLILYTDGLIERRDDSIDNGLERLRDAATARRPSSRSDSATRSSTSSPRGASTTSSSSASAASRATRGSSRRVFPAVPRSLTAGPPGASCVAGGAGSRAASDRGRRPGVRRRLRQHRPPRLRRAAGRGDRSSCGCGATARWSPAIRDAGVWRARAHTESSGHGMEIMRALSDDVHVHRTPQGTTVVMEARRRRLARAPRATGRPGADDGSLSARSFLHGDDRSPCPDCSALAWSAGYRSQSNRLPRTNRTSSTSFLVKSGAPPVSSICARMCSLTAVAVNCRNQYLIPRGIPAGYPRRPQRRRPSLPAANLRGPGRLAQLGEHQLDNSERRDLEGSHE